LRSCAALKHQFVFPVQALLHVSGVLVGFIRNPHTRWVDYCVNLLAKMKLELWYATRATKPPIFECVYSFYQIVMAPSLCNWKACVTKIHNNNELEHIKLNSKF
jgi:hypothetical protein